MKKKSKRINPHKPLTNAEWDAMGPWMRGIDGLPTVMQPAIRRIGRPRVEHPKEKVTVRFDHDVLAALRAKGKGWQTKLNSFLRNAVENNRI